MTEEALVNDAKIAKTDDQRVPPLGRPFSD
jgi:hypothetical protein